MAGTATVDSVGMFAQELASANEHPTFTGVAPFNQDLVLVLARVTGHFDRDLTGIDGPTVQQADAKPADLARHGGYRGASHRENLGRHGKFQPFRRSVVVDVRPSNVFEDVLQIVKRGAAPGIRCHCDDSTDVGMWPATVRFRRKSPKYRPQPLSVRFVFHKFPWEPF